jgi:hypothetical protein
VRKLTVIGLIVLALGALAVIVPASASQNGPSGARWASRQGHATSGLAPQAPTDVFTTNDNFFTWRVAGPLPWWSAHTVMTILPRTPPASSRRMASGASRRG